MSKTPMRPEDRRERILALLADETRIGVDLLAERLGVSRETIRRDLAHLDRQGRLRKVHGGAMRTPGAPLDPLREGPFHARLCDNTAAKRAIAHRAAALFRPGDTLFVDTGTTTLFFAEELARASGLTIVTNSTRIASLVARSGENRAFLIGGEWREEAEESLGALAVEQIRRFHATHAVLTVGAIEANGFMDFDLGEAEIARAMIEQARTLTILADSSKFDRRALFRLAPLAEADRIVTECPPASALAEALAAAEVEILLPEAS